MQKKSHEYMKGGNIIAWQFTYGNQRRQRKDLE